MGHGGVGVVFPASLEAPVEELRLCRTRLLTVGETDHTDLDVR